MRRHVYYYTLIGTAFELASTVLEGAPGAWLPAPAEARGVAWEVTLRADGALPGGLG